MHRVQIITLITHIPYLMTLHLTLILKSSARYGVNDICCLQNALVLFSIFTFQVNLNFHPSFLGMFGVSAHFSILIEIS
jgi:hypothetical protein